MADKNPFGSMGLGMMGSERQHMTHLFSNEQKANIKKALVGSAFKAIGADDFFNKMFGKEQPNPNVNYQFTKDFSPGASTQLRGTPEGINPNKIGSGLGVAPGSYVQPQLTTPVAPVPPVESSGVTAPAVTTPPAPSIDDENNQAWGHNQTSEFTPRDTSQDQMPTQFAQGPVAPPVAQFPQPPQSNGGLMKLFAAFG
jgi:hypothetical protein